MKKIRTVALVTAFLAFLFDWGVMGLKLYNGNYNITVEAYIALVCLLIILICAVSKIFTDKCPHCGKIRISNGKYCPYCGKEI